MVERKKRNSGGLTSLDKRLPRRSQYGPSAALETSAVMSWLGKAIGPKLRGAIICLLGIAVSGTLLAAVRLACHLQHRQLMIGLESTQADYRCDDQSRRLSKTRSFWRTAMDLMGDSSGLATCNVVSVTICKGDPDDRQLSFLRRLRELESLELRSSLATDETVERIVRLQKLRSLTIAGERFTIKGLLRLRDIVCLERLRLDLPHYEPIELAVLRSELAGVELLDIADAEHVPVPIGVAY